MQVSVVIPTLGRAQAVADVLQDLGAQTLVPQEIILVDQTDGANPREEVLANGAPVRWLVQAEKNASKARNTGARLASSEWLLFLDDDVRFESSLLESHDLAARETGADACTGGVLGPRDRWSDVPKPEADGRYMACWRRLSSYRTTRSTMRVEGACSANFLIRRDVLLEAGGFDERYYGICEDAELAFRLATSGFGVWHDWRPWVNHLMLRGGGSRPTPLTWAERRLSIIQPRTMKLHLLVLAEHFGWAVAYRFLLLRFAQSGINRGLYLEKPLFMATVVSLLRRSLSQAKALKAQGPILPFRIDPVTRHQCT